MVRRIVALLLLGAWQLQGVVPPHFHAGMSVEETISHGERRHVHLSHEPHAHHAHHDHGHSHQHATPLAGHLAAESNAPPADHDDDAVYLTDELLANVARTSHLAPQVVVTFAASIADAIPRFERHTLAPPRYGGQVPAFLDTTRLLL